ncbi:MAG TPA: patatin-like phospholipase family protein [Methylovorus sp.]|nr:patatin-like phospholipase family protein [Methylovorus sp.]
MKTILSIDGGGIRGLIPALVLTDMEARLGKPIWQLFDLIAGTSTGGILAMGCARRGSAGQAKYAAKDLVNIYQTRGKQIFSRSLWKGVSSIGGIADELYSADGIEEVLQEYFADDALQDCLTNTLITSYDLQNRAPVFFKSWKPEHKPVLLKQVARATSAAPTYFEPTQVEVAGSLKTLVDGGVFINSPSVSAYAEARRIFPEETEFLLVSLGTGELVRPITFEEAKDWGKAGWVLPLLSCMFDGVADAANYQMQMLLGDHYYRLQTELSIASDDMDNTTQGNIENLKAEAKKLIRTNKAALETLYQVLAK